MSQHGKRLNIVSLEEAKNDMRDGDLLLFRRRGVIAVVGRGVYSHAGKVAWWDAIPFCLEVREFYGGRAVTLESRVRACPGRIDLYRANPEDRWPEYDRQAATAVMKRFAGCRYGYWNVLGTALTHLPLVRWALFPSVQRNVRSLDGAAPFCSEACSLADRLGGGVDPVPQLDDRFCEPSDLARSAFYEYRFTFK